MDKRVIFVHGLGGSSKTWGNSPMFISADKTIGVSCHDWAYPTAFLGLKYLKFLQKNYLGINELADALKTYIDEMHRSADEIVLVGHSMGGLIIRQYLLNMNAAREVPKVNKIVLYAVPNNGSELAKVVGWLSLFKNPQLVNLKKGSAYLDELNRSWNVANIEAKFDLTVVVGGNDRVVTAQSARGTFPYSMIKVIPEAGHIDICKPATSESLSYQILRNAILKKNTYIALSN